MAIEETTSTKKSIWKKPFLRLFLLASIAFFTTTLLVTILFTFINPNLTMLMVIKRHIPEIQGGSNSIKHKWVSIDKISPQIVLAVIAAEDNKFMEHNGFDWEAIKKAMANNKRGKKLKGASTISQQTAKNVFLWPRRSWFRKGMETYFTFLIETFWSKKRIIEIYLNVIELGRGVYGVESASQIYFNKPAYQLNKAEASMLATTLPNPIKRNPARPSTYMIRYQRSILRNMYNLGKVDLDNGSIDTENSNKSKKR